MICLDRAFEFVRNVHVLAAAAAAAAAVVVVVVDDVAAVLGNQYCASLFLAVPAAAH